MDIKIDNLSAEKASDGRIYVYFTDGRLSDYRVCVAVIKGDLIKWGADGVVRTAIV